MVELLTVIAMIAVLAVILFPVFARAREQARARSCMMNLVNIAVALRSYAYDNDGWYPPTEDDLLPLMPQYIDREPGFMCPSDGGYNSPGNIPRGAPADESRWHPPQPPQPLPQPGEGMGMGGGMGGGMGMGGMDPGMGFPSPSEAMPPPGMDPGMMMGGELPELPAGTIMTSYYYRAGRRHNQTPLAPLCSDHKPIHNARANVLFSDGAVKLLPEGPWRKLGFETPSEIHAERTGEPVPEGRY
jgi:prepilin-type processing-associated H-X9-DG protein